MEHFERNEIDASLPQFKISPGEREKLKREKGMTDLELDQLEARRNLDALEGKLAKEGLRRDSNGNWEIAA